MQTIDTLTRLYAACGFQSKVSMCIRLVGGTTGDLSTSGGVAGLSPKEVLNCQSQNHTDHQLRQHDDCAHERKIFKARFVVQIISLLPFVRAVAICNSMALHMVHEESDIDLLVIARAGRVWSCRWWVTGMLALLRMRPGEARRDPVCASFFVDECETNLSSLMIDRDVYFFYWLRSLMPLFGTHPIFADGAHTAPEFRVRASVVHRITQCAIEYVAQIFPESFVHTQQLAIMSASIKKCATGGSTAVVLSDTVIKLHANDRRAELRDRVFGTL